MPITTCPTLRVAPHSPRHPHRAVTRRLARVAQRARLGQQRAVVHRKNPLLGSE